jgi:DNA anti-recombination protein RmuC
MPSLDERVAYLEGRLEEHASTVISLRGDVRDRFDRVDERFDRVDERFDRIDRRLDRLDDKLSRHFTRLVGIQVAVLIAVLGALLGG